MRLIVHRSGDYGNVLVAPIKNGALINALTQVKITIDLQLYRCTDAQLHTCTAATRYCT